MWALSHLSSWSQSICCQCLRTMQGMQWFALPWVPGVPQAWHLLSAGHHPRSNVSTSAPAAGTFPSELLSCFFPSRAIPSLPLPADGITRPLYPPEPRCNWIRAPAFPGRACPASPKLLLWKGAAFGAQPCLGWSSHPAQPCSLKGFFLIEVSFCAHNKMNKTPNSSWIFGGEWLVHRLSS